MLNDSVETCCVTDAAVELECMLVVADAGRLSAHGSA